MQSPEGLENTPFKNKVGVINTLVLFRLGTVSLYGNQK